MNSKIVLFGANAATTDRRKGYHLMPAMTKRLAASPVAQGAMLVVFGGPSSSGNVGADEFGLPTLHLGRFEDDVSLALLYSAADVLVAPYLEDNLPFVVLEALACGTPVVAFAAGGIPDAVCHEQNGFLADVGNTDELARGIEWVLIDEGRRTLLCEAAQRSAQTRFDIRDCARRFRDLVIELRARSSGVVDQARC